MMIIRNLPEAHVLCDRALVTHVHLGVQHCRGSARAPLANTRQAHGRAGGVARFQDVIGHLRVHVIGPVACGA